MKKEDEGFLARLKEEMLNQDKCCQAAPRYWVIEQTVREYGYDPGYADDCVLVYGDAEAESVEDAKEIVEAVGDELLENYGADEILVRYDESEKKLIVLLKREFETDADDEHEFKHLDDLCDWLQFNTHHATSDKIRLVFYKDKRMQVRGPLFLTKKACEEHIKQYGYNYRKPAPYALTAFRSPEIERIWKIIEEGNWKDDSVKCCRNCLYYEDVAATDVCAYWGETERDIDTQRCSTYKRNPEE